MAPSRILAALAVLALALLPSGRAPDRARLHDPRAAILRLPLEFEGEHGQFTSHFGDGSIAFLPDRTIFTTRDSAPVSLRFVGGRAESTMAATDPLPGRANYILGRDPAAWRTDVAQFARLRYAAIYDGIDLVYYGSNERLEHDFVVAPHADPSQIVMEVTGAREVLVTPAGDAELHTARGTVTLQRPVVYQELDGHRQTIAAAYVLADNRLTFDLGRYDRDRALVIDPIVLFTTPLGGNAFTQVNGVAVDGSGNIFVTGFTQATDFAVANAAQPTCAAGCGNSDAFVTALAPNGTTVLYSTYFGGSNIDQGLAIAVDSTGAAYITGTTSSSNFPVKNAFQATAANANRHAFVAKFGATGALVYSTYLGGTGSEDFNNAFDGAIAVDSSGAAYVAGSTSSTDFPVLGAIQATRLGSTSSYITKLAPSGSALIYSTYLGGSSTAGVTGIAVDSTGAAYITGFTDSANFPTTAGALAQTCASCAAFLPEAFVAKLAPAGSSLLYSTFLGDAGGSTASGIAIDTAGAAYISGSTASRSFPTVGALQPTCIACLDGLSSGFASKLNATGTALVYSSYLTAHGQTFANAIAVDTAGAAFVTGSTDAPDFPSLLPAQAIGGLGIATSTDGGLTFTRTNQGLASSQVNAIARDPSTAGVVYAATLNGVFKSTDGGATWAAANTGLPAGPSGKPVANVQSLAVAPGVVLVGVLGNGVFRSTNGGANFVATSGLPASPGTVAALAFDPSSASTVYAGIGNGPILFKSVTGGASWARSDTGLPAGDSFFTVTAIAVDPTSSSNLYLSSTDFSSAKGIFASTDGGVSWHAINTGLSTLHVNALAIDPVTPSTLYAGTDTSFSPSGGVFKTTDGGAHWVESLDAGGFVVDALAIDPTTHRIYAGLVNAGVTFSSDAGASWNTTAFSFINVSAIGILPAAQLFGFGKTFSAGTSAFVTNLSADGATRISSSYLGGLFPSQAVGIAIDAPITAVNTTQPGASKNFGSVNSGNNGETKQAAVVGTGISHANLEILKEVDKTSTVVDDDLTYTITVTNHGPDPAVAVFATDDLPSELSTVICSTGPHSNNVTVFRGFTAFSCTATHPMAVGESFFCKVVCPVSTTGDVINSTFVHTNSTDDGLYPQSSTVHTTITQPATATIAPSPGHAGNVGVGVTTHLPFTIANQTPSTLIVTGATATGSAGVVFTTTNTCSAPVLPGGACVVTVDITAPVVGLFTGTLTLSDNAASLDVVTFDGTAIDTADVSVTKEVDIATADTGDVVTYKLTVKNNGPAAAVNPKVIDTTPTGVTNIAIVDASGPPYGTPAINVNNGIVTCTFPSNTGGETPFLNAGDSFICRFSVKTTTPGTILNTAVASDDNAPAAPSHPTDSATTVVRSPQQAPTVSPPDVALGSIGVGASKTQVVVVTNADLVARLYTTGIDAPSTATATIAITADTCSTLPVLPLASCNFTVKATCLLPNIFTSAVTYRTTSIASPQSIPISGNCAAASTTALSSSSPTATFGAPVMFTATVTPSTATGMLMVLDGATAIGTATLSGGVATVSSSTLAVGTHSITAAYAGDANAGASTSAPLTQTITQATTTTTLASSANPSGVGQAVVFTATVATGATGSVKFAEGATTLGTGQLDASGKATFSTSSLAAGVHAIVGDFNGDGNFSASTSAPLQQTVSGATDFSITASPPSLVIQSGGTGTTSLSVAPTGGFAGALAFACSDLPAHASCNFSPATVTLDGSNTPATVNLTIDTASAAQTAASLTVPRTGRGVLFALGLPVALFGLGSTGRRRRWTWGARGLLVLGLASACGGDGAPQRTPVGTYSVTVTATGSMTHTTTIGVVVQ